MDTRKIIEDAQYQATPPNLDKTLNNHASLQP